MILRIGEDSFLVLSCSNRRSVPLVLGGAVECGTQARAFRMFAHSQNPRSVSERSTERYAVTTPSPLRPGQQLASTTCSTRIVVVRVPSEGVQEFACGGEAMIPAAPGRPSEPASGTGTLLGKRYVDAGDTVEVLCTSPGAGELSYAGVPMAVKSAQALPASD